MSTRTPTSVHEDAELNLWVNNAFRFGGGFVKTIADAAFRADAFNYGLMRPLLLQLKGKYPDYEDPRFSQAVKDEAQRAADAKEER